MKTTIEAESSSPRNTGSDVEPARTAKPRKKLNRQPASCSGCRQRRTRCDRGRPCLECHKRKTTCDYTGASAPPSIPPVSIFDQVEREEYIKRLEARLEALEKSTPPTKPSSASSTPPAHDFSLDDLAAQLSIITIGKRVRAPISDSEPHTLRTQLESIMASQSNLPPITFIQPEQQFSLDLVAKYLVPSLEELCSEHLPSRPQIDILAQCFLNTVNLWSPVINPFDWNIQLDAFWNSTDRLNFRPTPTPSNPPHLTRHYLTQFIAILYAVMGHGLSTLADIHHLESTPENQSSVGSPTSSPPRDDHLWTLSQAEKISLANRWFRFSLGLLMSPEGNIYVKPTIFGIRAMSILSNVEHAPENLDHGIFFWSLTSNLAISVGLFREPPIADDEDIETLDETEIESRRELAWSILALDWAGYVVANGKRPLNDADQISVKFPGTVISRATKIDPADGWPENPLVCIRRLAAQMDHLMRQVDVKVLSGHPVTYEDLAETVKRLDQLESSVPPRLQMRLSADGKSLETVVKSITAQNVPVACS
ncbi:hypothetical protein VP01_2485g5 [Puccinia sorghi]|uniref:Zn(2)-C6 fungal-type domain-containing protein n=1 Tax=Puccinia sorghi TaxID=27349 RepID=A0A0L6V5W4_9BASI|nr:hypothetical protein VP01_2485g5 [Puccinia sorghi]